jgi:hypothetical protein
MSSKIARRYTSKSYQNGRQSAGATVIPRMCLRKIKSKVVPIVEFICISWHRRQNKAKLEDLKEETFVSDLSERALMSDITNDLEEIDYIFWYPPFCSFVFV